MLKYRVRLQYQTKESSALLVRYKLRSMQGRFREGASQLGASQHGASHCHRSVKKTPAPLLDENGRLVVVYL